MLIRYFATNRNYENLAKWTSTRSERLSLEAKGYYWVDMSRYMSHYFATLDTEEIPKHSITNYDSGPYASFKHPNIDQIVICVHGFNCNLHEAYNWFSQLFDRCPIINNDDPKAKEKNLTAFVGFSWPSNGSILHYLSDQREAISSGNSLANLIAKIRQETGKSVSLLCHSMGNFLVCHMLKSLIRGEYEPKGVQALRIQRKTERERNELPTEDQFFVDRLIMLAPDIERRHVTKCVTAFQRLGQEDEEVTYLGQFYSGLEHLVGRIHNFYSRSDSALAISNAEKGPRKVAVAAKGVLDSLTFGLLDFLERNPDEKWEQRLGLNQHPVIGPPNMYSHNSSAIAGREIGHSDHVDSQEIVDEIAMILEKPL